MALNVERFRTDLRRLIDQAELLDFAMVREVIGDDKKFKKEYLRSLDDKKKEDFIKRLPTFKINDLNELLKVNSIIDVPQWRHISLLGDIRNLCGHNKEKEPTQEQVADLVDGTEKVVKTIS